MSVSRRGFASMPADRLRELAQRGAARQAELGLRYRFTSDAARAAGRAGGRRTQELRRRKRDDQAPADKA